ncbi:3,4-dihydroxy-2-butanone-4-phosphate synthase [Pseudonocardia sichuanensis]
MADVLEAAAAELVAGRPVLVLDDCVDVPTGVLLVAAERVDARAMAFLVRESSGIVCVAMTGERLDALRVPPLAARDAGPATSAFGVAVDLKDGITTGISARDRALTARALADPATRPADLVRPGHVLPLRARDGGVLERARPAEAAVELCTSAGLAPAAALATAVDDAGEVAGPAALAALAERAALPVVRVSQVVAARRRAPPPLRAGGRATQPTAHGAFRALGYAGDGAEHLALVRGDPTGPAPVPVHVHTECVAGDVLGSLRCTCAARLDAALAAIDAAGRGVLVYLRTRAAPGVGPVHALRGCAVPGADTAALAAHVLRDLGVRSALLLGEDPGDGAGLAASGITVAGHRPLLAAPAADAG